MKQLKINRILMDVDGTMTWYLKNPQKSKSMMQCLNEMVQKKYYIDEKCAADKIAACGNPAVQCLSEFLDELQIDKSEYFEIVRKEYAKSIYIPEDTIVFLEMMKKAGIPVCTATTNSVFATLVKMAVGDLADVNGSPYISAFHPGNEFKNPEGKFSAHYFSDIIKHHKYDTANLLMLGDEIEHDLYPALQAGIRYGVVIDRKQKERLIEKDGGIFISDLRILLDLLEI